MKIELTDNKVFFEKQGAKKEIHPFWLRERVNSENFLDQKTQQRLFDPTMLKNSSEISKVNISDKFLEVSFKDVPTKNNFITNFANSIGSIRRTNFGEFFNVKSKPNPNDLAYTSLALAPHTDNPYRNPVPCIQMLHCIENEVNGGLSTLVDGYAVTEKLKKDFQDYYNILTDVKVRFQFIDQSVILEDWAEMIQLNEKGEFKQVRFSPRLDFVPLMEKNKLELFYSARKKISELYNSDQYRVEFKLNPGDLLMMDNHRLLHGRTSYDANQGNRFLQGCYIDYDSTEGKLNHLKRKFNL